MLKYGSIGLFGGGLFAKKIQKYNNTLNIIKQYNKIWNIIKTNLTDVDAVHASDCVYTARWWNWVCVAWTMWHPGEHKKERETKRVREETCNTTYSTNRLSWPQNGRVPCVCVWMLWLRPQSLCELWRPFLSLSKDREELGSLCSRVKGCFISNTLWAVCQVEQGKKSELQP